MKQKGASPLLSILLVVVAALFIYFGYLYIKGFSGYFVSHPPASQTPLPFGTPAPVSVKGQKFSVTISADKIIASDIKTGEKFNINKQLTKRSGDYNDENGPFFYDFNATIFANVWSPDNSILYFADSTTDNVLEEIVKLDLYKRSLLPLTSNSRYTFKDELAISPDGTHLAFVEVDNYGTGAGYTTYLSVVNTSTAARKDFGAVGETAGSPSTAILKLKWKDNQTLTGTLSSVSGEKNWQMSVPNI